MHGAARMLMPFMCEDGAHAVPMTELRNQRPDGRVMRRLANYSLCVYYKYRKYHATV